MHECNPTDRSPWSLDLNFQNVVPDSEVVELFDDSHTVGRRKCFHESRIDPTCKISPEIVPHPPNPKTLHETKTTDNRKHCQTLIPENSTNTEGIQPTT